LVNSFFSKHPTTCLLLISPERCQQIIEATKDRPQLFNWVDSKLTQDNPQNSIQIKCKESDVDLLVIEDENSDTDFDIVQILSQGTQVIGVLDFWQKYIGCIPPSEVNQSWLTKLDLRIRNPVALKLKRVSDIIFSAFALILTAPLLLIVFFIVAVDSGFPVIFSQTRTGFLNKTFTIYKIRTMRNDAEKEGAAWASENDNRITTFGKILRKLRIDEIPQFWNVIKGDMSIVGPRPEQPEFQNELVQSVPHWNTRHLVKPGITGWAQIKFKYASTMQASEQKLAYDLYYLRNLSFALDFEIILGTLRSIGKGSR
jgi:lipopolysaccharide/colanic/teichoic acid biosynthesis glycosyltransferase